MDTDISERLLDPRSQISEQRESIDDDSEEERIPNWRDQITVQALSVSAVLGSLFCIITHKLSLTVGMIPSLNIASGLLGFFFVKSWTGFLSRLGLSVLPFTRQENTVIRTCVVACYGLPLGGGGSYLIAMDEKLYQRIGADYPGNRAEDVKNLGLGWMIAFSFVVSFVGVVSLVPLQKVMIMDYKLCLSKRYCNSYANKQLSHKQQS